MNTNLIRELAAQGRVSLEKIADALDELDERTRARAEPEPTPDTCDCGICSEERQGVSTIPGCYCLVCRHRDARSRGGIYCEHPTFSQSLMALSTFRPLPEGYGCVFGERKEAE